MNTIWSSCIVIFGLLCLGVESKHTVQESSESSCSTPDAIQYGYVKLNENDQMSDILSTNSSELEEIPTVQKGMILYSEQGNHYPVGSIVSYGCDEGYRLKPPNYTNICSNGKWLGESPSCVPKGCPMPSSIVNGYFLEHSEARDGLFSPGSSRQFLCHPGYIIEGPDSFTCDESGNWTPDEPVACLPSPKLESEKMCSIPPDVWGAKKKLLRGLVSQEGALHLTVIEYTCLSGYRNVLSPCDPQSLTCKHGNWSGTPPKCEKSVSCLAPKDIEHGFVYEVLSLYPIHSQVYYSCKPGFTLVGPLVLTCQESGCWVPSQPPSCEPSKSKDEKLGFNRIGFVFVFTPIVVFLMMLMGIIIFYMVYLRVPMKWLRGVGPRNRRERQNTRTIRPPPTPVDYDPDRVALIPLPYENQRPNAPPSYEEATRSRPMLTVDHQTRHTPHTHRSRGHRVVVPGGRRSRHRDHPDNISYQSIGSARQSSGTSRSMSMHSSSACDSLGSTDTMAISDSTNVTVETMSSGAVSGASQTMSCRGLAGSRASVETSSLANNEGVPLIEEAEGEDTRPLDSFSFSTRDSDSMKDNVSHTRSATVSLQDT